MRIAILSFWHVHAADYAGEAEALPGSELAAVWDEVPERGRVEAGARNVPFVEDLDALMADPAIDGVVVTTATTAHAEVIPRAARVGKHVFAEKVIAPTLAESLAIVRATREAGITFGVALSRAVEPGITEGVRLIREGAIGQPTSARVRVAHDGVLPTPDRPQGWLPPRFLEPAESGGGALIDLGAHPLYVTRLLLGLPARVSCLLGRVTGRAADDQAAVLLGYDDGALGVAETGFVSRAGSFGYGVEGTEGGLSFRRGDEFLTHTVGRDARRIELPAAGPTSFARWVAAAAAGTPLPENLRLALELSALADASARSAGTGCAVELSSLAGWPEFETMFTDS